MKPPSFLIVNAGIQSQLEGNGNGPPRKPWMPPGGPCALAGMVPKNWKVRIWDELVLGKVPYELIKRATLVGLSGLTPSRDRAIAIAKDVVRAGKSLIAGGRDVIGWSLEEGNGKKLSDYYPSVCTSAVDVDLMGEILDDCASGQLKPVYALPPRKPVELTAWRRDLTDPACYFAGWTITSSCGCNRHCVWCTVGGCGYYHKDPAILAAELATIRSSFFIDVADSLAGNRRRLLEVILPVYGASGKHWGAEAAVADLSGNTVEQMAKAGCRILYIGVESVTRVLSAKSNRAMAEDVIRQCRKHHIVVIGSFILDPAGDETEEEIREMIAWATRWLDFAQFSLTAALPGCAMRETAIQEGTLLPDIGWESFDGAHATIAHALSPERREELHRQAHVDFSRLDHVLYRTLRAPWRSKPIVFLGGLRYRRGIPLQT